MGGLSSYKNIVILIVQRFRDRIFSLTLWFGLIVQCLGSTNNFEDFVGNRGLTCFVVRQF